MLDSRVELKEKHLCAFSDSGELDALACRHWAHFQFLVLNGYLQRALYDTDWKADRLRDCNFVADAVNCKASRNHNFVGF